MAFDLAESARRLIIERAGQDLLVRLLKEMLDHAAAPMSLGLNIFPRVEQVNAQILHRLEGIAELLDEDLRCELVHRFWDYSPEQALIVAAVTADYFAIPDSILARGDPKSRLFAQHPTLHAKLDKHGLLPLTVGNAEAQILVVGSDAIHYHQLLRRDFIGNINDTLVQELLNTAAAPGNTGRIAVDERRLTTVKCWKAFIEKDYYYGPRRLASTAQLDDPQEVGTTVMWDPQAPGLRHSYSRTIAHWEMRAGDQGAEKHFQAEERVADGHGRVGGRVLIRYLHAIRDPSTQTFLHCDGAVKLFTEAGYAALLRREASGSYGVHVTKTATYRKVFRVDGAVTTEQWARLMALWFRGNTLIVEYLEGAGAET
ncbi:hypothetical protein BOX37_27855 [Nocardia mangyaensis]|jgi:hypothetical protein|uniref:Uncharacterized protein n=1 Tax=Nocardia mangyaensis TaxID=2213200 RepID=A0A1J0VYM7_9NOCA|nr:hypothetical protein [Nocardia mangyaensis]APE37109.1 hypothetical protein BOX37_27855 [Nocardia mangyaensis]